jgi:hypothetical protein
MIERIHLLVVLVVGICHSLSSSLESLDFGLDGDLALFVRETVLLILETLRLPIFCLV